APYFDFTSRQRRAGTLINPKTIKSKQDPCAKFKGKDLRRIIWIDNVKPQRLKKGSFYGTRKRGSENNFFYMNKLFSKY
ncbi:MAG: hypothetical protein WBM77_02015, partial [Maribacter sp.]